MKAPNFFFLAQWNETTVLKAETLQFEDCGSYVSATFGGLHDISTVEVPASALLRVEVSGNGRPLCEIGLTVMNGSLALNPSLSKVTHDFVAGWGTLEEVGVWEILRDWCKDIPLLTDWRWLSEAGQHDWVGACSRWSGVPIGRKPLPMLELDGTHVTSKAGFYCALGETFIGHRGYSGGNLDGFWDCLIHYDVSGHDKILRIRNIAQIRRVLDTIILEGSPREKYTDIFLEMLSKRGYEVQYMG